MLLRLAAGTEEAPGALGNFRALQQIEVEAAVGIQALTIRPGLRPDSDVLAIGEPRAIEWELQRPGTRQDTTIAAQNVLRIVLSGIVTKHRNGPSAVRAEWLNLGNPGEAVVMLRKSPLVIAGHDVGVGTIPRPRLEIDSKSVGDVKTVVELAMLELVGKSTRLGAFKESPMAFVMEEYQPCRKWPCIRWRRLHGETIPWFAVQWPGVSRVVKVRYMHNQALDTGQFIRGPSADLQNHLRSLFSWWEGREHYVKDLVDRATPSFHEPDGPFSIRTNDRALEDRFIEVYRIPLKPRSSLYARLDGDFANMSQFGLVFEDNQSEDNQSWFKKDAVFLARWDEAGVRFVDGTMHQCPLPAVSEAVR